MSLKNKLATLPIDPADLPKLVELPLDPAPNDRFYEREGLPDGSFLVREWTLTQKVQLTRETEVKDLIDEAIEEVIGDRKKADKDALRAKLYAKFAESDVIKHRS